MSGSPTISVVVPTYRRPGVLAGCLRALHAQEHEPLEVLVCRRSSDELTAAGVAGLPPEERRLVREVVIGPDDNFALALQSGIDATHGELIALTDDDAEAPTDWLTRLVGAFEDPTVAACGGRDLLPGAAAPASQVVGKVLWFGRVIGAHHDGLGPPRDVDVLKGVNCCFRGDLLRRVGVDPRLRGAGNVVHTELAMCLPLRRAGYRIVYDPTITVQHHVAPRMDGDQNSRGGFNGPALRDAVHNETLLLLEHLSVPGRVALFGWSLAVGTRGAPGLLGLPFSARRWSSLRQACERFRRQLTGRLLAVRVERPSGRSLPAREKDERSVLGTPQKQGSSDAP